MLGDGLGRARQELDAPAAAAVDGVEVAEGHARGERALPLLRSGHVVVDVLGDLAGGDLDDGAVGRQLLLAGQVLQPHDLQLARADAAPDAAVERDFRVPDVAARLQRAVADREDAPERAVADEAHLERLVGLEAVGDEHDGRDGPAERRRRERQALLELGDLPHGARHVDGLGADEAVGAEAAPQLVRPVEEAQVRRVGQARREPARARALDAQAAAQRRRRRGEHEQSHHHARACVSSGRAA